MTDNPDYLPNENASPIGSPILPYSSPPKRNLSPPSREIFMTDLKHKEMVIVQRRILADLNRYEVKMLILKQQLCGTASLDSRWLKDLDIEIDEQRGLQFIYSDLLDKLNSEIAKKLSFYSEASVKLNSEIAKKRPIYPDT